MSLKGVAKRTLSILEEGVYVAPSGQRRSISQELAAARKGTRLFEPAVLAELLDRESSTGHDSVSVEVIESKT